MPPTAYKKPLVIISFAILLLGAALYFFNKPVSENITSSEDETTKGWSTFSDMTLGITFQYPENLSTTYIHPVDWPPQVRVIDTPFTCTEAGNEIDRAGRTEVKTINDHVYCVTKETEGAAGSTYTNYAYAFPKGDTTVILIFSLRAVQCGNYDESQKNLCESERNNFDIDGILDRIVRSSNFNR